MSCLWMALTVLGLLASSPALAQPTQAQRGRILAQQQCAACHGARLEGRYGPPLSGPRFLGRWAGRSAEELRRYILARMPLGRAGSLSASQILDLLAFILQTNGISATKSLAPLDLEKIKLPSL